MHNKLLILCVRVCGLVDIFGNELTLSKGSSSSYSNKMRNSQRQQVLLFLTFYWFSFVNYMTIRFLWWPLPGPSSRLGAHNLDIRLPYKFMCMPIGVCAYVWVWSVGNKLGVQPVRTESASSLTWIFVLAASKFLISIQYMHVHACLHVCVCVCVCPNFCRVIHMRRFLNN